MADTGQHVYLEEATATVADHRSDAVGDAVVSFVTGYGARLTGLAYANDLKLWLDYCAAVGLDPLGAVRRTDIGRYARDVEQRGRAPATLGAGCQRSPGSTGGALTKRCSTTPPQGTSAGHDG